MFIFWVIKRRPPGETKPEGAWGDEQLLCDYCSGVYANQQTQINCRRNTYLKSASGFYAITTQGMNINQQREYAVAIPNPTLSHTIDRHFFNCLDSIFD